jgi:hypothetical protein
MRRSTVRLSFFWTLLLSLAAFARVHFRSITTGVAYDLGQLKTSEGKLLEDRSTLRGDLARISTKKKLEDLSQYSSDEIAKGPQKK